MGVKFNPLSGKFDLVNKEKIVDGTSAGQMAFWNGSTWTYTETSEMFWDDTNKRLGIGTNSPEALVHKYNGVTTSYANERTEADTARFDTLVYGSSYGGTIGGVPKANLAFLRTKNASGLLFATGDNVPIYFAPNDIFMLTLNNNGVIIGAGAAGVDYTLTFDGETNNGVITWMEDEAQFKLVDDLYINTNSTSAFVVEQDGVKNNTFVVDTTNGRIGIGTATPSASLDIWGEYERVLRLSSAGCNHGMTSVVPTNVFGSVEEGSNGGGGLQFRGMSEAETALAFVAYSGSTAPTKAVIAFIGGKKSGTNATTLADNEILFEFQNRYPNTRFRVMGNGDTTAYGSLTVGRGAAGTDYTLTFNGETNDGVLTWMEDEDYFKFSDDIMILGGENIVLDTATGTKIGTATTQLLGFYNATPVDQPDTVADAATQDLTGTDTVDKTKLEADLTSCKNTVNALIDRLQELGLIA